MSITPIDILNKQFDNKMRGYDRDQVDNFLDIIVANFEKFIDENKQLTQELETTKEKLAYYEELQESLNSSILIAQEAAERLKSNARQEAELILYEAEKMADHRLNDLSDEARLMMDEIEDLRQSGEAYRQKIEETLTEQLDAVREEYLMDLFSHNKYTQEAQAHFENTERRLQEVNRLTQEVDEQYPLPDLPEKPESVVEFEETLAQQQAAAESQPTVPGQAPTPQARQAPHEVPPHELPPHEVEPVVFQEETGESFEEGETVAFGDGETVNEIDNTPQVSDNETINGQSIRFELPKD